jgi:ribosomal protein S15P/S13E
MTDLSIQYEPLTSETLRRYIRDGKHVATVADSIHLAVDVQALLTSFMSLAHHVIENERDPQKRQDLARWINSMAQSNIEDAVMNV